MLLENPKISIVMTLYNNERYVEEAIYSLLRQSFSDFELIVVDDFSTDNSLSVVKKIKDKRIKIIENKKNLKISKSANLGINASKGKYIARMDSDDICYPNRLEKQFNFLENNPSIDMVGSWIMTFGSIHELWNNRTDSDELRISVLFHSPFANPSVMGKSQFFKQNLYDETYDNAEDYELWGRTALSYNFSNLPEVLLKYRVHEKQISNYGKVEQVKYSDLVRLRELNRFLGSDFVDKKISEIHLSICNNQQVSPDDAKFFFEKMLINNSNKKIYNNDKFVKIISFWMFKVYYNSSNRGLYTFVHFLKNKSSFSYVDIGYVLLLKLFIKCLFKV